jgi:hypothetical protein
MITITVLDIIRRPLNATHEILYAQGTSPAGRLVKWDFLEVPVGSEITEGHAKFATRHLNNQARNVDEDLTMQGGGGPGEEAP